MLDSSLLRRSHDNLSLLRLNWSRGSLHNLLWLLDWLCLLNRLSILNWDCSLLHRLRSRSSLNLLLNGLSNDWLSNNCLSRLLSDWLLLIHHLHLLLHWGWSGDLLLDWLGSWLLLSLDGHLRLGLRILNHSLLLGLRLGNLRNLSDSCGDLHGKSLLLH